MRRAATNAHPYTLPPCSWAWVSRVGTGMGPRASVGAPELLAGASDDIGAGRGVWGGGGRLCRWDGIRVASWIKKNTQKYVNRKFRGKI